MENHVCHTIIGSVYLQPSLRACGAWTSTVSLGTPVPQSYRICRAGFTMNMQSPEVKQQEQSFYCLQAPPSFQLSSCSSYLMLCQLGHEDTHTERQGLPGHLGLAPGPAHGAHCVRASDCPCAHARAPAGHGVEWGGRASGPWVGAGKQVIENFPWRDGEMVGLQASKAWAHASSSLLSLLTKVKIKDDILRISRQQHWSIKPLFQALSSTIRWPPRRFTPTRLWSSAQMIGGAVEHVLL